MPSQLFMARQPILDRDKHIFAYEIFYRDNGDEAEANIVDARLATSSVLVNLLNQVGLQNSIGDSLAFINVGANILLTDILYSLPPKKFVFELSEDITITNQLKDAIKVLFDLGFRFALDNATCQSTYLNNFSQIMPYIEYIKIDTTMTDIEDFTANKELYKDKKFIAQKVEIPEVYEAYKEIGFDFFQGYFFAKPHLIQHNRIDPKHKGVIRIFNMLQTDTHMQEICDEFEKHNELTLQLLQFLNSTTMFSIKDSSSIGDIVRLVGKEKLLQWLLLIIYSKSGKEINSTKSPLSLLAQHRVDIMLGILKKADEALYEKTKDEARYVAMLSLLESVFNVPLAYLLENFEVEDSVENALLSHSGTSGRLLAIALSIEKQDYAATQVLLKSFGLNVDDLDDSMLESFIKASSS